VINKKALVMTGLFLFFFWLFLLGTRHQDNIGFVPEKMRDGLILATIPIFLISRIIEFTLSGSYGIALAILTLVANYLGWCGVFGLVGKIKKNKKEVLELLC